MWSGPALLVTGLIAVSTTFSHAQNPTPPSAAGWPDSSPGGQKRCLIRTWARLPFGRLLAPSMEHVARSSGAWSALSAA